MVPSDSERKIARVEIDRTRCFSHERCVRVAPDVFSIDEEGISVASNTTDASDAQLQQAAEACPVQAIFLYGQDGALLFPKDVDW